VQSTMPENIEQQINVIFIIDKTK